MRTLFGTDGIRGTVNRPPMTADTAYRLGLVLGAEARASSGTVLFGRDTRLSGELFGAALTAGLLAAGADALDAGVVPTPAVAGLARSLGAAYGVVISASHNPYVDNGLKVFGNDGFKLEDAAEQRLEDLMADAPAAALAPAEHVGRLCRLPDAAERYRATLQRLFAAGPWLRGRRVVVDCAHGACYAIAPALLRDLGADVQALGVAPDGRNINAGCGSLHPAALAERVRAFQADIGLAFDGDGDRLIVVDERGNVVDGDRLMAICARRLSEEGRLGGQTVVSTVMSNVGLDVALESFGARLLRTDVGDRYVLAAMRAGGYTFGGEQSGHLILLDRGTTGDGLLSALQLLEIMVHTGERVSCLPPVLTRFPQTLVNVRVLSKPDWRALPEVLAAVQAAEAALGRQGRVLVRYSGTENLARVMVEGPDEATIHVHAERIAAALRGAIGA